MEAKYDLFNLPPLKKKSRQTKEIVQLSYSGELLHTYSSLTDVHQSTGISMSRIVNACREKKECGGYFWRYGYQYNSEEQWEIPPMKKTPVTQFNIKGEFLAYFKSIRAAEKTTGISNVTISKACRAELYTAGGFRWEYGKLDKPLRPLPENIDLSSENDPEIWKDIPEFEGLYKVSNFGRVKRLAGWNGSFANPERILSCNKNKYHRVTLHKDGIGKVVLAHRLVAMAFIPNPNNSPCVNHINGLKWDNRVQNLEWVTHEMNINHAIAFGLHPKICFQKREIAFRKYITKNDYPDM